MKSICEYSVSVDDSSVFDVEPYVDAHDFLLYRPTAQPGFQGSAVVTITAKDREGVAARLPDGSIPTFTVHVDNSFAAASALLEGNDAGDSYTPACSVAGVSGDGQASGDRPPSQGLDAAHWPASSTPPADSTLRDASASVGVLSESSALPSWQRSLVGPLPVTSTAAAPLDHAGMIDFDWLDLPIWPGTPADPGVTSPVLPDPGSTPDDLMLDWPLPITPNPLEIPPEIGQPLPSPLPLPLPNPSPGWPDPTLPPVVPPPAAVPPPVQIPPAPVDPPPPGPFIIPPDPGLPDPGLPDPGLPDPGLPDPGLPDPGLPDPGLPDPGLPDPGLPDPGLPDPGLPDPGLPDPGLPDPGLPDPGLPDPGLPDPVYPIPDYPILDYPILVYPILVYPILDYPILDYLILVYLIPDCLIPAYLIRAGPIPRCRHRRPAVSRRSCLIWTRYVIVCPTSWSGNPACWSR